MAGSSLIKLAIEYCIIRRGERIYRKAHHLQAQESHITRKNFTMNHRTPKEVLIDQFLKKIDSLLNRLSKAESKIFNSCSLYLSRKEACKMLKIPQSTLHHLTKIGWLQSYKIGNRVLYKLEEVEEASKKTSINKHKKYTI